MNYLLSKISITAKKNSKEACVIGRYVLSFLLKRKIYQSVDILTKGSGISLAQKISKKFYHNSILTTFKRFKTAKLKKNGTQIEFIGDDNAFDKNIATLAISLNTNNYGLLIDPLDTYYKNTRSLTRSIRFASELQFSEQISFYSILKDGRCIRMVSVEEIINDFNKIILSQGSSSGLSLLYEIGLLSLLLPEITCLKEFEEKEGSNHKNNFNHTLEVMENVSEESNSLWLRWAALLHDIGKSITKKYIHGTGWTFHAHESLGARMIPYLFYRLRFPLDWNLKYVQKIIQYSSRPIAVVSYETTDSAIRRLLFSLGEDIEDLILLCKADITTKNVEKKLRYITRFLLVEEKLKKFDIKNSFQKWSISGNGIMHFFQLQPSHQVGIIKKAINETFDDVYY